MYPQAGCSELAHVMSWLQTLNLALTLPPDYEPNSKMSIFWKIKLIKAFQSVSFIRLVLGGNDSFTLLMVNHY